MFDELGITVTNIDLVFTPSAICCQDVRSSKHLSSLRHRSYRPKGQLDIVAGFKFDV